jgi:hypothetical protein
MPAAVSYQQADPAYRKDPAAAQSHVKHILKSPAHYQAAKKRRFTPTLTMQIGTALHCLVLEGEEQFNRDFILKPDGISLTTKEGRDWKAAVGKKTILSTTDQYASWDAVHGMAESLRRLEWFDPKQVDYRKYNEVSLYFEAQGIDCKARLDRLLLFDNHATVLDLKTTDTVEPRAFLKKVVGDMNYLFQSAWYTESVQAVYDLPCNFVFIGVERMPPYLARVFEISRDMLEEGLRQTREARTTLSRCLKTKTWEAPAITHEWLELPPWYRSPLENGATIDSNDLDRAFDLT